MKSIFILFFAFILGTSTFAQVFSNKVVGKKKASFADSLKQSEYPYLLPIWGAKVTKAGYHLPYSAGLGVTYFQQTSAILIENLKVGFNNGPMYDLDGIVRFGDCSAKASAVTFRPDVWVFPFLNVYGIMGISSASTNVAFGVFIPDSTGTSQEVFNTSTVVEFTSQTFGFGFTPTIGVAGGFLALDMNFTWTDVPQLDKPAQTFTFGPRFGKNFTIKRPDQTLAVWVGGFRVNLKSGTAGSINLSEVFPEEEWAAKVDAGLEKVAGAQEQVDIWWSNLTPIQQQNPINQAKYNRANDVLATVGGVLNEADQALNDGESASVQYAMDKSVKDPWNFIVGGQYQYNMHWMVRAEFGFLGSRTQGMVGLQYRFGL
jgi:hypothetical protein